MYIDFHTHIFPEQIAARTIEKLQQVSKSRAHTDATLNGLKASMKEYGIDYSVVLPVVTKPKQFASVQKYALEITGKDGIISFGGMHPLSESWKEEIKEIADSGLKGMKIHPDYQQVFADDMALIRCVDYAMELGLTVVLHAGLDVGYPDPIHCTPQRSVKLIEAVDGRAGKLVLAHIGGHTLWDDVERYLAGRPVYFDLAYSLDKIPPAQLKRLIALHGPERFLWATDSPWAAQGRFKDYLEQLGLPEDQLAMISHKNAAALLGLDADEI